MSDGVHVIDLSLLCTTNKLHPLNASLRQQIFSEVETALQSPSCSAIVIASGSDRNFSAGADLKELAVLSSSSSEQRSDSKTVPAVPSLIDVCHLIESSNSKKPIVAAISGVCLGGGLELALSCHARVVVSNDAKIGLPEVQVGVIPGAGGTQRLPRLVGLAAAAQMIVTGQIVSSSSKKIVALVDMFVNDATELTTRACQYAAWLATMVQAGGGPLRRTLELPLKESLPEAFALLQVVRLALPKKGIQGQVAAIKAMQAAYTALTPQEGLQREFEEFMTTLLSAQGQARQYAFLATRAVQKPIEIRLAPVNHVLLSTSQKTQVAVIGAGTMGRGIALTLLLNLPHIVFLVDVNKEALQDGMDFLHKTLESYVKRRKLSREQAVSMQHRLQSTTHLQDLQQTQLVVEAVVEKMQVKRQIWRSLDQIVPPDCILVSNTSTLDIDAMAEVFPPSSPHRQAQFAGWHFFSPAHVMKLVEIVVGKNTSTETIWLLQRLTKIIKKIGVLVGNCDGFCGNRLLKPYQAESVLLLTERCNTIQQVDQAFLNFGMVLGPFQMSDLAGNDVGYHVRGARGWVRNYNKNTSSPSSMSNRPDRYTELADVMVSEYNRLGQKVGKGWYDYDPLIGKGRKGLCSTEMQGLIQKYRTGVKQTDSPTSEQEMIERVFYPLVNEGFKCLEEGIVRSPSDIDVVYMTGYGWPAWRGGPMYWADHEITLPVLLSKLQEFCREFPTTEHYKPAELLMKCVSAGVTLHEYHKKLGTGRRGQLSRL